MHYFWSLFSSDNGRFLIGRKPHLFALFYEVDKQEIAQRKFCISWLPDSKEYTLFGSATKGRNWGLKETLLATPKDALPVCSWGPAEVSSGFFERAYNLKTDLDQNRYQYKVLDWTAKNCRNCTSALAELDQNHSFPVGTKSGHIAAKAMWKFYQNHYRSDKNPHPIENYFEELKDFKFWEKAK